MGAKNGMRDGVAYRDGQNVYMVVDPRYFRVFFLLSVIGVVVLIVLLVTIVMLALWINDLNIISRLFALLERAASGGCVC